jgi:hypothetical protein
MSADSHKSQWTTARIVRLAIAAVCIIYAGSQLLGRSFVNTKKSEINADLNLLFADPVKAKPYLIGYSKKFATFSKVDQELNLLALQKTKFEVSDIREINGEDRMLIDVKQPDVISPVFSADFRFQATINALKNRNTQKVEIITKEAIQNAVKEALIRDNFSFKNTKLDVPMVKENNKSTLNDSNFVKELDKIIYSVAK